jgi:hypothetical protein
MACDLKLHKYMGHVHGACTLMYVKPRLKSKNHLGQFEFNHEQGLLYKSETNPFWPDLGDSLQVQNIP